MLSGTDPNMYRLTAAQALAVLAAVGHATFTGLAGASLAPTPALATVPVSVMVAGTLATAFPISFYMKRRGRRAGFVLAALCGVANGLLSALALYLQSFALLTAAAFLQGVYQAGIQYYRFAAIEMTAPPQHGRAVSTVLGGGLAGALVGPTLFGAANDLLAPVTFAGAYLAMALLAALAAVVLGTTRFAPPIVTGLGETAARPLGEIARKPAFLCALGHAVASYALMVLIMTAAPLHIVACGFSIGMASTAIQWHILAMFLPSFFTGHLIARFGVNSVLIAGALLFMGAGYAGFAGIAIANFQLALIAAGVGWNLLFTGGTTLLARTYQPSEAAKVQGLNEVVVFGVAALASLLAGTLLATLGWQWINGVAIVGGFLILCLAIAGMRIPRLA